jgi:hypothetical protein
MGKQTDCGIGGGAAAAPPPVPAGNSGTPEPRQVSVARNWRPLMSRWLWIGAVLLASWVHLDSVTWMRNSPEEMRRQAMETGADTVMAVCKNWKAEDLVARFDRSTRKSKGERLDKLQRRLQSLKAELGSYKSLGVGQDGPKITFDTAGWVGALRRATFPAGRSDLLGHYCTTVECERGTVFVELDLVSGEFLDWNVKAMRFGERQVTR